MSGKLNFEFSKLGVEATHVNFKISKCDTSRFGWGKINK
jgi:hypothetical protein